jgi:integrase
MRIMDFDDQTIRDARKKLEEEKSTPATVNRYVSQMRRVWHWGTPAFVPRDQAWPDNLMMTEPAGRSVFLDDAQLAALLKAAAPNKVMHAAILLSVGTGIRQGELLRLQWKDVDLDGGKITLLVTKNNTPRTVHVPSTVVAAMRGLRKVKKMVPTASVFLVKKGMPLKVSTLEARWRKIRAAAGLANFRWHDLRHSCASFLARRGASLLEIASVLGHKSPSMVMRYAHLTQGQPVKGHTELDALLSGKAAT